MIATPRGLKDPPERKARNELLIKRFDKRLPRRPRPLHRETSKSYLSRALAQNFLPLNLASFLLNKYRAAFPDASDESLLDLIAEQKGGLEPGFFAKVRPRIRTHPDGRTCERCFHSFGDQYICRKCAAGQIAMQYPWIEQNVCLRHRLWIAPGVHTILQPSVGDESAAAEKRFRKLVRSGRLDAPMLTALVSAYRRAGAVRNCTADQGFMMSPTSYTSMVAIAQTLSQQRFTETFFNPRMTFYQSHRLLESIVETKAPEISAVVSRGLWEQYRPVFLRVREWADSADGRMRWTGHDFGLTPEILNSWRPTPTTSEPFRRFMDVGREQGIRGTQARAVQHAFETSGNRPKSVRGTQ